MRLIDCSAVLSLLPCTLVLFDQKVNSFRGFIGNKNHRPFLRAVNEELGSKGRLLGLDPEVTLVGVAAREPI